MTAPTAGTNASADAERGRLVAADSSQASSAQAGWRRWGPYLAERAWGSVREDYSADGDAWANFPFEHARSRTYRWNEDGLAGFCDRDQDWCLALALWNGNDPILKERLFGLTNSQGNHGEDVKERYWFVDGVPSHAWMSWRYHYPQQAFPYADLVAENARRSRHEPEYELDDTGVFAQDRYFDVTVDYAKAARRRLVHAHPRAQRRPRQRDDRGAADVVVPQHLGLGIAERPARTDDHLQRAAAGRRPFRRTAR